MYLLLDDSLNWNTEWMMEIINHVDLVYVIIKIAIILLTDCLEEYIWLWAHTVCINSLS